jgi:hypothetical protein
VHGRYGSDRAQLDVWVSVQLDHRAEIVLHIELVLHIEAAC